MCRREWSKFEIVMKWGEAHLETPDDRERQIEQYRRHRFRRHVRGKRYQKAHQNRERARGSVASDLAELGRYPARRKTDE